jgi:uncharacterized protein (TIGR02996 family)
MNDEAFFQAVLDEPDDEDLRLIYADWLEERGDPRGEFIRVQCRLAHLPRWARARPGLEARARELLAENLWTWNAPLHRLLSRTPLRNQVRSRRGLVHGWAYRRGFVEEVTVQARAFVDHGDALFRIGPLRHARLRDARPVIGALAESVHLAKLTTLELYRNGIGPEGMRVLARSPHLGRLTGLNLRENWVGDEGIEALAATPSLANLTFLGLASNGLPAGAVAALTASSHLNRLHELDLRLNGVGREGARALAGSPSLARLTALRLSGGWIGDEGVGALAGSPHLHNLRVLDLSDNHITAAGVRALVESSVFTGLIELDLQDNPIRDRGMQVLLQPGRLPRLMFLNLKSGTRPPLAVGEQTIRELKKRFRHVWL